MKRTGLFALMISLLFLGGCAVADTGMEEFKAWQEALRTAETVSFTAAVTADFGDKTFDYAAVLSYADGTAMVELQEPEILRGVMLRTADGGMTLAYDGASLELGDLDGLSPASALPLVLEALQSGRVLDAARVSEDGVDCRVFTLASAPGELRVWLLRDGLVPTRAELSEKGRVTLICDIADWATFS